MAEHPFYQVLEPAARGRHVIGQIFWIPAFTTERHLFAVRTTSWDRKLPIDTARFGLRQVHHSSVGGDQDLYQQMPIPELKLKTKEDLLVKKVKRRPAILIYREGINTRKLATYCAGIGDAPEPHEHVFAPIFSLRKEENVDSDYPDIFIQQVQTGKFPELMHLPPTSRIIRNESMVAFAAMQVHPRHAIEETDLRVDPLQLAASLEKLKEDTENKILYL
jgi:hypothetical protein